MSVSKQWCRITSLNVKAVVYPAQFCLLQMGFFYYSYQVICIVALWEGDWVRKWNTLPFSEWRSVKSLARNNSKAGKV